MILQIAINCFTLKLLESFYVMIGYYWFQNCLKLVGISYLLKMDVRIRPPRKWLLLCLVTLVSVFAVIALLGSSSSSSSDYTKPEAYTITNYRRLKEQTESDYVELKTFSSRTSNFKEIRLCGKEREDYVPCYNVSANLLSGFKDGEEFDRRCEVSQDESYCLVRPPRDYKTPLSWPAGRDVIWNANVKVSDDRFLSPGTMTKRLMMLEENQISFDSDHELKDHSRKITEIIGLGSDAELWQAGVRMVLDIDCGFGSLGAHLLSLKVMTVCMAAYELTGSQVQLSLERGLPAIIGSLISRKLPFPSLSYDMIHCAHCGVSWGEKDGLFLVEANRILKPGGYFVYHRTSLSAKREDAIEGLTRKVCWTLIGQQQETFIWQKTTDPLCYCTQGVFPPCGEDDEDVYQPLASCVAGTASKRWVPVQNKSSDSHITPAKLEIHGVQQGEFFEELEYSRSALRNYWSLLTPLIFSDHPKRPGDEDPLPPFNMIRNVMDMNARFGGLNSAFLEAGKSAWVMNVVPVRARNTLPLILDQGFIGVLHDWCDPFPTYPRTYDMLHANGLLSHLVSEGCSITNLLLEMDRILRPEGWVVLSDKLEAIENSRMITTQIRWEARVIDLENDSDQRLLVCQKPFVRK